MDKPLILAMAGLPGSGKSTLSRALCVALGAVRWDKDELRHLLFPPGTVAHDRSTNDLCMELLYAAAPHALTHARILILDGRPFAERDQRRRVGQVAREAGAELAFVYCSAPMDVLRGRVASPTHVAMDRDERLLGALAARWEPWDELPIAVDTSAQALQDEVSRCLRELRARSLIR